MKPGDEDEAWRQIVENYGDRPRVDDDDSDGAVAHLEDRPPTDLDSAVRPIPTPEPEPEPEPFDPGRLWAEAEAFVPPPVAPFPLAEPRRLAAWLGLFGVPVIYLLAIVAGVGFPGLVDLVLLAWMVGGFGYLVWTMPPRPHDPWDDGSRI